MRKASDMMAAEALDSMGSSKEAQTKDIHASTKALSTSVAPNKLDAGAMEAMVRIMALVLAMCVLPSERANDVDAANGVVVAQTTSAEDAVTFDKGRPAANEVAMT